jgi:hypothetical protein
MIAGWLIPPPGLPFKSEGRLRHEREEKVGELDDARRLLEPHRSPALEPFDRRLLLEVLSEVKTQLAALERVPPAAWKPAPRKLAPKRGRSIAS